MFAAEIGETALFALRRGNPSAFSNAARGREAGATIMLSHPAQRISGRPGGSIARGAGPWVHVEVPISRASKIPFLKWGCVQ